ncbi:hypothetical protein, conserved [Eimeria praecox]|uniref:Uncharacterized protein n=1 Tax=Eimeria praecox TaxID=51316 RepID=U6G3K9_9EIME|nr:hypothetical protein, conserved [Eimeria praecox]
MHVFRLRHPVDTIGGPQVMAACAQAAALLDAYRSVRSAYLGYHMQHDPHAGMSEDSAAWMAGRFNLMLQEDQAVANDKNVRKGLKWCIESALVVQRILSQRAHTDVNESPASPGNAFNNLLDASRTAGASHTRRITQYLLSRCRDESKETSAQVYAWAALSVGVAETFFRGQLACTINAQESSEIDLGLVKAALSISWGRMEAEEVLEPHALLVQAVSSISKSKLLTDSDKKRVEKNCSMIGKPQMQPFWPFDKDPQHLDEALLSMYSVPSSGDSEAGHGEEGSGNQEPRPEPHAHSGSSVHPDDPRGPVNEGADPSGEQPYPRGQPPPPPPPTHRGKPPLEAMEEERPHQSTAVVSQENHEEQAPQHETDEAPVPTQEEQAQPQEAEEGPPVPPPHEENQPSAEDHNKEEVEDKPPSGLIAPVILANHDDHELPKPKPPSPPPGHENPPDAPSKEPELEPNEKLSDQSGAHPSPVPIVQEHSDGNIDETQRQRKLPERISIGSASSRFPGTSSTAVRILIRPLSSQFYHACEPYKHQLRSAGERDGIPDSSATMGTAEMTPMAATKGSAEQEPLYTHLWLIVEHSSVSCLAVATAQLRYASPTSPNKHDKMDGLQRQLKYPPWTAEAAQLRPPHNALCSPAALPRFTGAAATANAVVAEGCKRTLRSRGRLIPPNSQESSRLEASAFCDRAPPTQTLTQQRQRQSGMPQSQATTVSCRSHGYRLFPFLTRSCSSPEVNAKDETGAIYPAVGRGSLQPTRQSKASLIPENMTSSLFGGPIAPLPLFDSRAAAATAASCSVDNNLERFEGMLEPIVKLLVAKSVEQAVEEAKQEQQLLTLHKRRQQLLQHQQQKLLELEQHEARRHLQAQQAIRNQLIVKEHETQLWRRLWVAHIGTTLLDENSFEKIVDQLDEESSFVSSADIVPGEFLAEVAKAASAELQKRKDIGDELVKWWLNAEAVQTASRRQQELLLWGQHLKMREKVKRQRERRRGVAHLFVTPADFEALGPDPYSFQEEMRFEDAAEMHRKAQATVEAAADLVSLSLLHDGSEKDGHTRQLALKAEAERLTEAFEEQQRQRLSPGSDMAAIIRTSQVIFEAKGTRISEVEALLKYEYGDLHVRLDRRITFANTEDESASELESEESREID